MNYIETRRLQLHPCNLELLESAIASDNQFAEKSGFVITEGWSEFKDFALPYVISQISENPNSAAWWTYFPVLKEGNILIGSCGFKGSPDENGQVEIGYEVATKYRSQGIATEIAEALVKHAFSHPSVNRVLAHTLPEENASVQILRKLGFSFQAQIHDADDGLIWRWEKARMPEIKGKIVNSRETDYLKGIKTERLTIRPLELSDAKVWEIFISDPNATEFLPLDFKLGKEKLAFNWMQKQRGRYANGTYGLQALIDRNSGEFIGQCGLLGQIVEGKWELEVGYHILPKFWRKGYASEAAKAWMNWAAKRNMQNGMISLIASNNFKSQGVARKNGLIPDFQTEMMGLDIIVFRFLQ